MTTQHQTKRAILKIFTRIILYCAWVGDTFGTTLCTVISFETPTNFRFDDSSSRIRISLEYYQCRQISNSIRKTAERKKTTGL